MERRFFSAVDRKLDQNPILSPKSTDAILSLILNPCTSESILTSLLETLKLHLQNPNSNDKKILSLLSTLSHHHPSLRHRIDGAVREFILLPSTPTSSLPHALSLLDPGQSESLDLFSDESLFLSLCFFHCVKTRRWMLRNVSKFRVRPSVLLTVFLGFTKDPFPYIREAALDGLAMWNDSVVVEDRSLVECCYFRAVELLFDAEDSVRRSAVRAVCEWGQLLVTLSPEETKRDLSDALFVQLCLMVRDMDMETRIAAFNALGKILTVSEAILLQTLSKKALAATKEKNYPGQYTAKVFKITAAAATFTFVHGLEDEFYQVAVSLLLSSMLQVRRCACHALQMLTGLSAEFAGMVVPRLMDMLNDDSKVVRLQALQTLHHMAINDPLKVEESHLDMLVGALIDDNVLIRSAARKTLQLTKSRKLAMFRSCIDTLIKTLELYPQDEADIFYGLYKLGRIHGKFVISIIREVSQELEPSFNGKLNFNKARTAALLMLAISAPVSFEQKICSIPPQIYSYAVTMLGRLSRGLVDVMSQDILLAYLSYCSRLSFDSTKKFEGEVLDLHLNNNYIRLCEKNVDNSSFPELMEFKKVNPPLQSHGEAKGCVEIVFQNVVNLWPLIQLGYINEVQQTLRGWKEELRFFSRDLCQSAGVLVFALKYLHVIKLLGKAWACTSQGNIWFKDMGILETLLGKMERRLKEILYRYVGLSREGELHILELLLVTYTLKLSCAQMFCLHTYINKLKFVLGRVEDLCKEEGSIEVSHFVTGLLNLSCGIDNSEDGGIQKLDILQNSVKLFSLRHIVLSGDLKYVDAEVEVFDNDFQNPLPFVSGLPVGIPLNITLHNISSETRLWVAINLGEKSTQFVFLDLHEFGGCNETKKFKLIAPFTWTPKVKHLLLKISVAMECLSEDQRLLYRKGPKHELIHISEGKEVHLSMAGL